MSIHYLEDVQIDTKRRKLHTPIPTLPKNVIKNGATLVDNTNGTVTPLHHDEALYDNDKIEGGDDIAVEIEFMDVDQDETETVDMEVENFTECNCGYLHGPGQGNHEDRNAVGFAEFPLLRGPD